MPAAPDRPLPAWGERARLYFQLSKVIAVFAVLVLAVVLGGAIAWSALSDGFSPVGLVVGLALAAVTVAGIVWLVAEMVSGYRDDPRP